MRNTKLTTAELQYGIKEILQGMSAGAILLDNTECVQVLEDANEQGLVLRLKNGDSYDLVLRPHPR